MKKNLFVLFAVCLSILAAIIPVAGSTGDGGSVTIVQPNEGAYSIGDTLTFSGTNNASGTTYLFITGPNLNTKGSEIQSTNPHDSPVTDGNVSTFLAIRGSLGNTWSWEWNTKNVLIDAGVYTVYAASTPRDLPHVNSTRFDTVTFIMKRPANAQVAAMDTSTSGNPAGTGSNASVTITQPKSGRYSIGDTVTFSGTNTGSGTTYLFITGPNLDAKGAQIQSTHPGNSPVIDNNASTFLAASVGADHQWSYTWNSQKALIDAGMFEVFAAGSPRDLPHINDTQYARVSFIMARPANIESPEGNLSTLSVVMKGNTITISGTAKGNPGPGVAIWIIGAPGSGMAGYADQVIVHPNPAGSYSLDLDRATTGLEDGKFHVVVQHPMLNNVFDIYLANNTAGNTADGWVLNRMLKDNTNADGTRVFKIRGAGSLQGNDAYEALVQVFEDPAVDDTIVIFPSTVNPAGSGDTVPVQSNLVSETPNPLTSGQNTKTTASANLIDQVWGFLSGVF
ncbi:hypothetical protein [Methanoregula sp.]|uniref:hypothetical protein n=1 Tax=Methanoregula sp. TaxID=2052170 RepID=UPI00236D677F|nr:hypothetical protein [Methanoregula sp.]MDD1685476.1 hypothetical protein [Methanoregula sp.]